MAVASVLVGITVSVFNFQIIFTLTGLALMLGLSGLTRLTEAGACGFASGRDGGYGILLFSTHGNVPPGGGDHLTFQKVLRLGRSDQKWRRT